MSHKLGKHRHSKTYKTVYTARQNTAGCGHQHIYRESAQHCGEQTFDGAFTVVAFLPATNPTVGRMEIPNYGTE